MDLRKTAAKHGEDIAAGRTDPVELAEAMLDAIAAHPAGDKIYARTMPDRARAEAEAARARARNGVRVGPLDGVPISWKDLFDTAGVATESGSRLLAGRVPSADAKVVALGAMAGLVSLGKTHQTELAFSGLGLNRTTETPPNIHDPALAPGGSSSGAAVSVAAGLASIAMGSDTGGSSRVPPAWNDLVGLKPPVGALSVRGVLPLAPRFDAPGPIGRTVEDVALLTAALQPGPAPDLAGATVSGCRFLVLESPHLPSLDPAPTAAFETALSRLSAAGALLTRGDFAGLEEAMSLAGVLYTTEAYAIWGAQIAAHGDVMDPRIRARFEQGVAFSGVDYVRAVARLDTLRAAYRAATASYDAVLLPSVAILPPPIARLEEDDAYFVAQNLAALRNTRVGNLMGIAALTLPTETPHCGVMAMVMPERLPTLFRLGAGIEAALVP
ncbi:MAG: amidase family protein [Pseudomonadota bacterium]